MPTLWNDEHEQYCNVKFKGEDKWRKIKLWRRNFSYEDFALDFAVEEFMKNPKRKFPWIIIANDGGEDRIFEVKLGDLRDAFMIYEVYKEKGK